MPSLTCTKIFQINRKKISKTVFIFYEFPNVKKIWCAVVEMFLSRFNYAIAFDKTCVLFGNNNNVH